MDSEGNKKKRVLLAYSGGLDTSVILKYLLENDYEVICFMADVGQNEDFQAAKVFKWIFILNRLSPDELEWHSIFWIAGKSFEDWCIWRKNGIELNGIDFIQI